MLLQHDISAEANRARVGRTERVIIDGAAEGCYVARSQYDSPEVDQEIEVVSERRLRRGSFCDVRITEADAYDLRAEALPRRR